MLYNGVAVMRTTFTVDADDEEEAKNFIEEAADEEFRGLISIEVENIKEVKS